MIYPRIEKLKEWFSKTYKESFSRKEKEDIWEIIFDRWEITFDNFKNILEIEEIPVIRKALESLSKKFGQR